MNPPLTQRREFRVFLLLLIPFILFTLCYGKEIWLASTYVANRILFNPEIQWDDRTRISIGMVGYECLVFAGLFVVSLALVSQFVLPVQTRAERRGVMWRLWLYVRGRHGPAISIKNGVSIASQAEKEHKRQGPGVALVDAVSALALERESIPKLDLHFKNRRQGLFGKLYWRERDLRRSGQVMLVLPLYLRRWFIIMFKRRLWQYRLAVRLARPRRPKIPKTSARIEGAGIVFTDANEDVRDTLDLRRQTRSRPNIKGLTRDGLEITTSINVTFMLEEPPAAANIGKLPPPQRNDPPFPLNKRSAFRAVYGSPVSKGEGEDEVKKWTDLPAFVASDIFRDLISTYTLDSLYRPNEDGELPLDILRREFSERVKGEQVLKDRGIKMLSAGFGKFTMPDPVTEQRISSWWAEWERRKLEVLAGGDLEAARIVQRARVAAQYDMVRQVGEILQNSRDPKALVALRLFQTLEAASGQPHVRRLLPAETIDVLKSWLDNLLTWFGRRPNIK